MALFVAGTAVAQVPELAIDLDRNTPGIDSTLTVVPGTTYQGAVRLVSFPGTNGYSRYNLKLRATPGVLTVASTSAGSHLLDSAATNTSALPDTIGRVLVNTLAIYQTAPAVVFNFDYAVSGPTTLTFLADSPAYGIGTLGQDYLLQAGQVTINSAVINTGVGPTDTPTPETTFTPTPPPPTDTPMPTDTPTPIPTPTIGAGTGIVMVEGFAGIHTSPQAEVGINLACEDAYFYPFHVARDSVMLPNQEAFMVVDLYGHVFTYSLTETCYPQIADESQFNFFPDDFAVAVDVNETSTGTGAYILTDLGEILPIGDAPDSVPSVSPPLPYRGVDQQAVIPGPVQGPGAIGTIATTGGWNGDSAIDFDMTAPDGALVLSRNGKVWPVGSAASLGFGDSPASPYFWPDLARRIEYMNVNGTDYYMILEGLGGIHVAGGSPDDTLRTNLRNNVLSGQLAYFAAQVGGGDFVGIDAANDFVPIVYNGGNSIGIMLLDGLGAIHHANLPFTFNWTVYFPGLNPVPGEPYNQLDTAVSLMTVDLAPLPQ